MASKKAPAPDATLQELEQLRDLDAALHGYPSDGTHAGAGPWAPAEQGRTLRRYEVVEVRDRSDERAQGPVTGHTYEVDDSLLDKLDRLPDAAAHGLTQAQIARAKQIARSAT